MAQQSRWRPPALPAATTTRGTPTMPCRSVRHTPQEPTAVGEFTTNNVDPGVEIQRNSNEHMNQPTRVAADYTNWYAGTRWPRWAGCRCGMTLIQRRWAAGLTSTSLPSSSEPDDITKPSLSRKHTNESERDLDSKYQIRQLCQSYFVLHVMCVSWGIWTRQPVPGNTSSVR
jgi:hypothetical protein